MHADERMDLDEIFAGEIAAVIGAKTTTTGDTLCDPQHPILLESVEFPEPVVHIAIEPKTKADEDKLSDSLSKLSDEDPTFIVKVDEDTGQVIIGGMGELHLEVLINRLKREFKVEANVGKPMVAYRETIRRPCRGECRFVKQTGGRGQFAHVVLDLEPGARGSHFTFEDRTKGGVVPAQFIQSVEQGARNALESGVITGYPTVDVSVALVDGSYHEVDSSEPAFETAAAVAVRDAVPKGSPVMLEPVMSIEVTCPEEFIGEVMNDFSARRAKLEGVENFGKTQRIRAQVPLAEMFGYANDLRSCTQGRAVHTMEFSRYEPLPAEIANRMMERFGGYHRFEE